MTLLAIKTLCLFILPLGFCLGLLVLAGLLRLTRFKAISGWLAALSGLVLWVCSMPIMAGWLMSGLEQQYPALRLADTRPHAGAIILGGMVSQPLPPRSYLDMGDAIDRLWHGVRLYRAGKAKTLIVAAGNVGWLEATASEADLLKGLLIDWGVPAEAILIESASRTTYENARNLKPLLAGKVQGPLLLVTSAGHMPRAVAVFAKAGIAVTPSPTDFRNAGTRAPGLLDFLPRVKALDDTSRALWEWLGLFYYRLRGWA